jgi:two-component system KDP operon response regulator KdpE
MKMVSKGARILVIDDERQMQKFLQVALTSHGYEVKEAAAGKMGLNEAVIFRPDLIILDLGLPDLDGLEVITQLREWSNTPVIIISARGQDQDKITALDAGADDYLTKPFSIGELLARIRAALRHAVRVSDEPFLELDDLVIDLAHRRVKVKEVEVKLTPTEYDLIKNLALNAGKVLTHKQLLRACWGPAAENDTHYLRVFIGQLRRKIEADPARPKHIITEPGVGYRLL